jgi:hypothetical protein
LGPDSVDKEENRVLEYRQPDGLSEREMRERREMRGSLKAILAFRHFARVSLVALGG